MGNLGTNKRWWGLPGITRSFDNSSNIITQPMVQQ